MSTYQDKFITMKKVLRLVCYKQRKETQPGLKRFPTIHDVCPYKFQEINENCKHCRWFQIKDETKELTQKMIDAGARDDHMVAISIKEMREIEYDPKKPDEAVR